MRKVKILFLAADPHSAPDHGSCPRLELDKEVNRIRRRVRAAEHRDALEFDWRMAVSVEDVMQALSEVDPQVVHFSGHGGKDGIVLVGRDGRPRPVPAEALRQLFAAFRGQIRLVVLNACVSEPQAEAIAGVVGCAIGTQNEIQDETGITFSSLFYGAIAFGNSVRAALEQARAGVRIEHPQDAVCLVLKTGPDGDPGSLVFVPPPTRWEKQRPRIVMSAILLAGAAIVAAALLWPVSWLPDCGWRNGLPPAEARHGAAAALQHVSGSGPESSGSRQDVASATALVDAGNFRAALPLLRRAADTHDPQAIGLLGIVLLREATNPAQRDSAIDQLRLASKKGDRRAMTALGEAYQLGDGVDRNLYWAEHWYLRAAKEGWPDAMRAVASLYRDGGHYTDAEHWYRQAVLNGSMDARAEAGRLYEAGEGVERDPDEARCLYRTAAVANSAAGMYEMGRIYQEGMSVSQDFAEAKAWYLRAVESGSAEAMNALGVMYQNGWGVPQDRDAAIRWYQRATRGGSKIAAGNLQAIRAN